MDKDSRPAPPRDARGTTPVMDFARLMVSMPERWKVTTPSVLPVLTPVPEQAAPADVEMAAEEPEEEDILGDAQVMFSKKEKDLMEGERAQLEE